MLYLPHGLTCRRPGQRRTHGSPGPCNDKAKKRTSFVVWFQGTLALLAIDRPFPPVGHGLLHRGPHDEEVGSVCHRRGRGRRRTAGPPLSHPARLSLLGAVDRPNQLVQGLAAAGLSSFTNKNIHCSMICGGHQQVEHEKK